MAFRNSTNQDCHVVYVVYIFVFRKIQMATLLYISSLFTIYGIHATPWHFCFGELSPWVVFSVRLHFVSWVVSLSCHNIKKSFLKFCSPIMFVVRVNVNVYNLFREFNIHNLNSRSWLEVSASSLYFWNRPIFFWTTTMWFH